ncbi:hypothetical protein GGU10DRAFT_362869 [Lentinula aff. detonsa]|uniref:Uncharacterized protein n=1 Tax=Lentinula aff. detonsa TaxID=2804958 RepID=A0AA38NI28_9AGAR|nr:hypothetical protein GGU10DRAFT_362869 [Lentinula aff. detonsa]
MNKHHYVIMLSWYRTRCAREGRYPNSGFVWFRSCYLLLASLLALAVAQSRSRLLDFNSLVDTTRQDEEEEDGVKC